MKWACIIFATALEVYGDYFLKLWALGGSTWKFVLGTSLYAVGTLGWGYLLKYETL